MNYQLFGSALSAVAHAVSVAFKMGAYKRFPTEKARAIAQIESAARILENSSEDQSMAEVLEHCTNLLERLENKIYEEK